MKAVLTVCALIAMNVGSFAQTTPTPTDPQAPTVATRDAANEPSEETNFTEDQAKSRIEERGYSNVVDLKLDEDGVWRGKADKSGTAVEVALDDKGNITEGAN